MSLSVIPISMKAYVTATAISGDYTLYQLAFKKNTVDEEPIDGVKAIYTDEDFQIPILSTQHYYGVYFNPIDDGDNWIFKAAYGGYKYTAIVAKDDTDTLSGVTPMIFSNDEVEERLLPVPTNEDVGKVPTVQEDGSYGLETPDEGVQELDDLTDVDITEPTDGQVLKYDSSNNKWINSTDESGSDYDEEAHIIEINEFDPSSPNSATLTFNANKFMSGSRSITALSLKGTGINKVYSGLNGILKPARPTQVVIPANTVIYFNAQPDLSQVLTIPLRFKSNYSDTGVHEFDSILVNYNSINALLYHEVSASNRQAYSGDNHKWSFQYRTITIETAQTISYSNALWLETNSDFQITYVDEFELDIDFKHNEQLYNLNVVITKVSDNYTLTKTITAIPSIPNAPTIDGTYTLQVTVASGTPTYSWESTT